MYTIYNNNNDFLYTIDIIKKIPSPSEVYYEVYIYIPLELG
jgi:hypothetical protein